MAVFNAAKKEIDIKIVYYGPALCGKTTNVQSIHKKMNPDQRGDMMSLATKDDRTLFFDFLPIELGSIKGFKTRFHIYTVPGQVYYSLTRRAVLTSVDGVVFVADSQADKLDENIESLKDLDKNLKHYRKDITTVPFVIQYNKRDLPNILPVDKLNTELNRINVPFIEACAPDGTGVMETLTECCKLVLKQMNKSSQKTREATEEDASFEPVIKITSENIPETNDKPELSAETTKPIIDIPEPVIDISEPTIDIPEPVIDISEPTIDIPEPSVQINDNQEKSPEIPSIEGLRLDPSETATESQETTPDFNFSTDSDPAEATNAEEITPDSMKIEDEPEISMKHDISPAGIQVQAEEGCRIVACGQPKKTSNTSIKIPITFRTEQDKEYTLSISITFDDFHPED